MDLKKILSGVVVVLMLIVIYLLMRGPKVIVEQDKSKEKELTSKIAQKQATIDSIFKRSKYDLGQFALKLAHQKRETKAANVKAEIAEKKLREFMAQTPEPGRDTLINQALAAKDDQIHELTAENTILQDRIAQQGATIVDLQAQMDDLSDSNVQLIELKDQQITQAQAETKKERRKKVWSQVAGVAAVIGTIVLMKLKKDLTKFRKLAVFFSSLCSPKQTNYAEQGNGFDR